MKIPQEPTVDVNLWDKSAVTVKELQEIVAMLVDLRGCKIVRGLETQTLWIQDK